MEPIEVFWEAVPAKSLPPLPKPPRRSHEPSGMVHVAAHRAYASRAAGIRDVNRSIVVADDSLAGGITIRPPRHSPSSVRGSRRERRVLLATLAILLVLGAVVLLLHGGRGSILVTNGGGSSAQLPGAVLGRLASSP